jgi:acetyl/propionyl-CoA carboxylase alpha subunit
MVTGTDLVAAQLRLAAGEDLFDELANRTLNGHAVECRLYAENPAKRFLPSPGTLERFALPEGMEGVRIDTGVREGDTITPFYDPMIAKIIAWGDTREAAISRINAALHATRVEGLATNLEFLTAITSNATFKGGDVWTGFIDTHLDDLLNAPGSGEA